MKHRLIIFTCLCFLMSTGQLEGKDSLMFHRVTHRITAEVCPTYNIPTHGFYRGHNDFNEAIPAAGAIHLKYGFRLNPKTRLGTLYPTAYQGIGAGVQSFFHHKITGTPVLLYIFQGGQIADLGNKISIGYEWNLGASYGWKINNVISSRWTIYINVGIPVIWHISPRWEIYFGPEFTHFSNGDTSFPNGGANTVGCRLGITAKINEQEKRRSPGKTLVAKDDYLCLLKVKERISYDLTLFGAWRADRDIEGNKLVITNKAFLTAGITFNPLYRFNRYFSIGPAIDILYDRSADNISHSRFKNQMACGISAKGELTMPIFSINLGVGYGLSTSAQLKGLYTTYNLKAFITDKFFLNIGYRLSSQQYCHNLMFGMGIRL